MTKQKPHTKPKMDTEELLVARRVGNGQRYYVAYVALLQNQWILLYMSTNRKCPDQTAWIRTLIWTFAVRIWHKGLFHTLCIILYKVFALFRINLVFSGL